MQRRGDEQKTLSMWRPLIINLCHKNCLEIYFHKHPINVDMERCGDMNKLESGVSFIMLQRIFQYFISVASQ